MNGETGSRSMRIKYLYDILFTLSLLLGACSGEESTYEFPQGNTAVGFSGDIPLTRATKEYITTDNLENIGVFAYFTHGDFDQSVATPNFMYNQLVAKQSGSGWSYSPVKFWPDNSTTERISFFAYAPYVNDAESTTPSFQDRGTAKGFPVLTYIVPVGENNQIDLLAATPVMNQNKGNISFKLYHTLTKLNIYVKSNDDTEGKSVTAFSVSGMKSGRLTYHAPTTDTDKGWKWTYPSSDEKETFITDITNFPVPNTSTEEKKLLATFFLLPNGEGSTFSITYQYTAKDANDNSITQTIKMENQSFPSTDNWIPGASVGYTIGIARKSISVMPEDGPVPWEENTDSETVNGTVDKQETD